MHLNILIVFVVKCTLKEAGFTYWNTEIFQEVHLRATQTTSLSVLVTLLSAFVSRLNEINTIVEIFKQTELSQSLKKKTKELCNINKLLRVHVLYSITCSTRDNSK
jgi:hypothetical protein